MGIRSRWCSGNHVLPCWPQQPTDRRPAVTPLLPPADVLSARVVRVLRYHREVVRDCSWHPHLPQLASGARLLVWLAREPLLSC